MVGALVAGIAYYLFKRHRQHGGITTPDIVISVVTFFMMLALLIGVSWYANKPLRKDKDD